MLASAAEAFGALPHPAAREPLLTALRHDEEELVREIAAMALWKLAPIMAQIVSKATPS